MRSRGLDASDIPIRWSAVRRRMAPNGTVAFFGSRGRQGAVGGLARGAVRREVREVGDSRGDETAMKGATPWRPVLIAFSRSGVARVSDLLHRSVHTLLAHGCEMHRR